MIVGTQQAHCQANPENQMTTHPYTSLENRFRRIGALHEAQGILHWDMAVMMPSGAASGRAEQLSEISLVVHEIMNDAETADLLAAAEADPPTDAHERANLFEMRRKHVHATAVEADLVAALTKASSDCEMCWRAARPANDFAAVSGKLENLLALVREQASAKSEALSCASYEALMDQYEPGIRESDIDGLFDDLLGFLPGVLEKVLERQARGAAPVIPEGPFPVGAQRALAEEFMKRLGFDFDRGRLDVSLHPFCGGVPGDVRITTRYSEDDFAHSLMGVLHETGHALYEANLPEKWRLQPAGQARGMAMHESQSLLIEMQLCRGSEFLEFAAPLMREAFGVDAAAWRSDNLAALYRRVKPDFIRVDADEVTYPFHVILRYRLEKALVAGDLSISELPAAWNAGMEKLLGIRPPDDRHGCLQDIHWFSGSFGYFPTYTMGALAAAQIFAAIRRDNPGLTGAISQGDFSPITGWCAENINTRASFASTDEILAEATGQPLGTAAFRDHLEARYLA